jgi:hypothetical protein
MPCLYVGWAILVCWDFLVGRTVLGGVGCFECSVIFR